MAYSDNNNQWAAGISSEQTVDRAKKLIAPMHLEALVIGKRDSKAPIKWKSISPQYAELADDDNPPLGEYLLAPICNTPSADELYESGIHLHWVLPHAYRYGTQETNDGSPQFPYAPNRWLVTRIADRKGEIEIKNWVVESDYIDKDADEPNWLMIDKKNPSATLMPGDSFKLAKIGRVFDLKKWQKDGNKNTTDPVFLTIMSPCDPGFAANYNSCKGVFGFHDEMDVDDPTTTFTYSVSGWISNPAKDILADVESYAEWIAKMDLLSWQVADADKLTSLPGGVICHAMINNVEWKKNDTTQSGKPLNEIKISLGNNVPDALAPLILQHKHTGFDEAVNPFLSALQYNVIADHSIDNGSDLLKKLKADKGPGANTRVIKKQVHNRSFQSVSGGNVWVLSKKRKDSNGFLNNNDEGEHNIPLKPKASELLKDLNAQQYQHDNALNITQFFQAQRYANWYKETKLSVKSSKRKLLNAEVKMLQDLQADNEHIEQLLSSLSSDNATVTKTEALKAHYTNEITQVKTALEAELLSDPNYKDYELTESKMPPFYTPNEPSLVITGLQPSSIYTKDKETLCRTEDQLINTIAYEQGKVELPVVKISYAEILSKLGLSFDGLPAQVSLLLTETLALSPLLASKAAINAWKDKGSKEQITTLTNELVDLLVTINEKKENHTKFKNGTTTAPLPELYAINYRRKQPWIPLYMEWEVEWSPGYTKLQSGEVFENWDFGEGGKLKLNNIDYSLKNDFTQSPKSSYKGRVALSADLGDKISDLVKVLGKDNLISDMSPMYQSLSSFNQQLTMLESSIQLPPVQRKKDSYVVTDVITNVEDQYLWNPSNKNKNAFYPVRSGMFRIKNLFIIDAFGQNMPIINASTAKPEQTVTQYLSSNIETRENNNVVVPPRLTSPCRLRFKWMSADGTNRETDTDPGTSPICGWMSYNKLDNSLMVFEANGKACGSLKLTSKNVVIWTPPPGSDSVVNMPSNIQNETLLNFVNNIFSSGKETFKEVLLQVDMMAQKALKAKRTINNVSNLPLGTPIAIAKASCQLELKSPIADWSKNQQSNSEVSNISFPFYLGNNLDKKDGLIGYYIENAVSNAPRKLSLPFAQYVSKPQAQVAVNEPIKLSVTNGAFNAPPATDLTLLLHPFMDVTISSGILPDASYKLPAFNIAKVLEDINFNFTVNPVLMPGNTVSLPLADVAGKKWTWMEKQDKSETETPQVAWNNIALNNKKSGKLNFEPITAKEGWLQIDKKD